jgi:hypothetical protein
MVVDDNKSTATKNAGKWDPVASGVALDMLHRTVPSVLHCRTAMSIYQNGQ